MSNTVMSLQSRPAKGLKAATERKGNRDKKATTAEAVAFFEAKLAKWQARVEQAEGAKLTVIIPGYAFFAEFPNGYSIYYELEP